MEVVEVGEKHLRLEHLVERGARGLESLFQILEDVRGLQLDVRAIERKTGLLARLRRNPGLEIAGELACGEYQLANRERLVIIGERARHGRCDHGERDACPHYLPA